MGSKAIMAHSHRTPGNNETIRELVNCLAAGLEKHFGQIERVQVLAESTLLDPRFKKPAFVNECYAEEAVSRVVLAMTQMATPALRRTYLLPGVRESQYLKCGLILRRGSNQPGIQNPHTEACSSVYPVWLTSGSALWPPLCLLNVFFLKLKPSKSSPTGGAA